MRYNQIFVGKSPFTILQNQIKFRLKWTEIISFRVDHIHHCGIYNFCLKTYFRCFFCLHQFFVIALNAKKKKNILHFDFCEELGKSVFVFCFLCFSILHLYFVFFFLVYLLFTETFFFPVCYSIHKSQLLNKLATIFIFFQMGCAAVFWSKMKKEMQSVSVTIENAGLHRK